MIIQVRAMETEVKEMRLEVVIANQVKQIVNNLHYNI